MYNVAEKTEGIKKTEKTKIKRRNKTKEFSFPNAPRFLIAITQQSKGRMTFLKFTFLFKMK